MGQGKALTITNLIKFHNSNQMVGYDTNRKIA